MPLGCYSGGQGLESVQLRRKSGQVWLMLRKAESELRESIKTLFNRATEGVRFFAVENMAGQPQLQGCSAELFVLLHLPILEGPDVGPILPITVVDNSCIKTSGAASASVGAGVYIPENNVIVTTAMNDPESNTINKA
ncbi:hypothetical protein HaLaN_11416 [Haematococcus lacustris]|uniref:Uncharacterized protein n=1 Tax=Haematococcus lacustris TaxID=44745 RepID=A0A699Z8Q1_HAELA|nr:hypothetical protein HaLaN_11416 [Haematococcus lacustris]